MHSPGGYQSRQARVQWTYYPHHRTTTMGMVFSKYCIVSSLLPVTPSSSLESIPEYPIIYSSVYDERLIITIECSSDEDN